MHQCYLKTVLLENPEIKALIWADLVHREKPEFKYLTPGCVISHVLLMVFIARSVPLHSSSIQTTCTLTISIIIVRYFPFRNRVKRFLVMFID